jgi:hypothetical protein
MPVLRTDDEFPAQGVTGLSDETLIALANYKWLRDNHDGDIHLKSGSVIFGEGGAVIECLAQAGFTPATRGFTRSTRVVPDEEILPGPPRQFHEVVPVSEMDENAFRTHLELRHPLLGTQSRLAHLTEHRNFQDQLYHVHLEGD